MALTTYDSLKVNSLTPDLLVAMGTECILQDGLLQADISGVSVLGDLFTEGLHVSADITVTESLQVEGNLLVKEDVTVGPFAGDGVRPLRVDVYGKVSPGRHAVHQMFSRFADSVWDANGADPILLLDFTEDAEKGALTLPVDWWSPGKRLSLFIVFEWNKQSAAGIDLEFWVDLEPEAGEPSRLVSRSLTLSANEGTVPTSGMGVLEFDLQTGGVTGDGGYQIEIVTSYRFNTQAVNVSQVTVDVQDFLLRPYARFSGTSGTNSLVVHAASVLAYEAPAQF